MSTPKRPEPAPENAPVSSAGLVQLDPVPVTSLNVLNVSPLQKNSHTRIVVDPETATS